MSQKIPRFATRIQSIRNHNIITINHQLDHGMAAQQMRSSTVQQL
jgi:hypothetical protein